MRIHPIGRRVGLGAAALVAAAALLLAPNAVSDLPAASGANCSDAELVFARGTSEPAGLGRVGQALLESLRSQTSGMNIGSYAVNYPASRLQLHTDDGAKDVINHVKSMASSCPNTKIVLGGYSQGADVIDIVSGVPLGGITWGGALPAEYANNVAAVAVFGNVANRTGGSLPSQSAMFGSKAIDLCNPDDPICHAGPGNEWAGHTDGYVPVYTTQAATFVAGKLMVGYSQTPPSSLPSTAPSATPGTTVPQAPSNPDMSASLTPSPTAQTPVPAVPVESTD